jgi:hypothetical protein
MPYPYAVHISNPILAVLHNCYHAMPFYIEERKKEKPVLEIPDRFGLHSLPSHVTSAHHFWLALEV